MIVRTVRLAARKLLHRPGATAITFLTLALGIAISTTIFTVAWAILVRPFVFGDQERLVILWANDPQGEIPRLELSYEEVEALGQQAKTIEAVTPWSAANFPLVAQRRGEPMHFHANMIGQAYFSALGVKPALGRSFTAAEHKAGGPLAAMISYDCWRERFGGDRTVVGEKLTAGTDSITVVGVLPRHLDLPDGAEVVFPLEPGFTTPDDRANRVLTAIARMRSGVTLEEVTRELSVIAPRIPRAHPESRPLALLPYSLTAEILGGTRQSVRIMFGMGVLVLLISLLNVACIALAQGVSRFDEMGVRRAVGATTGTTAFELFVEFSVLSLLAALGGFGAARLLIPLLVRIAPPSTPRIAEVSAGVEAFVFAIGAALVASVVVTLVQIASASESALLRSLRGASKSTKTRGSRQFLDLLAAGQVAVAVITVVMAVLLIQSFQRYASIDVGFSRENVLTFHLPRGYVMAPEPEKHHAFFQSVLGRIRALQGTVAAGSVLMRPLEIEQGWDFTHTVEGQTFPQQESNALANLLSVTPGYFEAIGTPRLHGRMFTDADRPDTLPVVVVGESFAKRYWSRPEAAIGKRVKSGKPDSERPWMTIVGVVRDVRYRSLTTGKLDIYVPYTQTRWSPNYVAVKTTADPEALLPAIRAIVKELDPAIPVASVRTTRQLVDAKLADSRLSAAVVTAFAIAASLLAIIGLYGVLSYAVRTRTSELGVRVALGATRGNLLWVVLRRGLAITLVGTVCGVLAAIAAQHLWSGVLYEVSGIDFTSTFALVICASIAAVVATLVPALRATRVDAAVALRAE